MFETTHIVFILCLAFAGFCLGVLSYSCYRHHRLRAIHDELARLDVGMAATERRRTGRKAMVKPLLWDVYVGNREEVDGALDMKKGKQKSGTDGAIGLEAVGTGGGRFVAGSWAGMKPLTSRCVQYWPDEQNQGSIRPQTRVSRFQTVTSSLHARWFQRNVRMASQTPPPESSTGYSSSPSSDVDVTKLQVAVVIAMPSQSSSYLIRAPHVHTGGLPDCDTPSQTTHWSSPIALRENSERFVYELGVAVVDVRDDSVSSLKPSVEDKENLKS